MRSKTIEKWSICFVFVLSMTSAAFLYSRPDSQPQYELLVEVNQMQEEVKSLPDLKILDFIFEKATALISASYKTNCIR